MSRSCPYRREISESCNWHQCQALEANIFILSQTGPTGFLLKEDGEAKNFKVYSHDIYFHILLL
jgi:E3 ubiquitin-protein ligase ZSWIM2